MQLRGSCPPPLGDLRPDALLKSMSDFPPDTRQPDRLAEIISRRDIHTVFQPIIRMGTGEIIGYESLSRPPEGVFRDPEHLFSSAVKHGMITDLELLCCERALENFARLKLPGKLLLNLSPQTVVDGQLGQYHTLDFLQHSGVDAERVVIELTEYQRTPEIEYLREALLLFRSLGIDVAIDDLGQGFSSLRLWSELRPDLVKIDVHFVRGIHNDPVKLQFLRSIQQIADSCGAKLIAEGIEENAELLVLRDLGIAYGQGFLIARPMSEPIRETGNDILIAIRSRGISVFPEQSRVPTIRQITAEKLLIRATPVSPQCTNDDLMERFEAAPDLHAMPVVVSDKPVGLINRNNFMARYARPYRRELFGKRSCVQFMDSQPLIVERAMPIHELSEMLVDVDRRYLAEGFVITSDGNYLGLGTGQDLIREITELQLESARYANPLTMLPGNVPIDGHIDRLLTAKAPFVAAYCDLNHFKPFNDAYGYRRGDMMIKLTARVLSAVCDPRHDFIGHIGGDDFILLFQDMDWENRCQRALQLFTEEAEFMFDDADRISGSLTGEDRKGEKVSFPLTTLSIGVVPVDPGRYSSHMQVSAAASEAKKQAKRSGGNAIFVERRVPRPATPD